MSTLDEITKEKQQVSEALARVDAQREKLASQLNELEAIERVLARYGLARHTRKSGVRSSETLGFEQLWVRFLGLDTARNAVDTRWLQWKCHLNLPKVMRSFGLAADLG
jgi:hypothetical protein